MRHGVRGKKLGRDTNARKALLKNLASDLLLHGRVKTTLSKAKFVQGHAEKIITSAKKSKLGYKRVIASSLTNKAFLRLMDEVAPGFEERAGGYTRIIKLSPRVGDNASMARIELVEWDKSKAKVKASTSNVKSKKNNKVKEKEKVVEKKPMKKIVKKSKQTK